MKSKFILYSLVLTLVCTASFGQAVQQKLEEVKKNPAMGEAAARADVRLMDKKVITDRNSPDSVMQKRKHPARGPAKKRKSRQHST